MLYCNEYLDTHCLYMNWDCMRYKFLRSGNTIKQYIAVVQSSLILKDLLIRDHNTESQLTAFFFLKQKETFAFLS